MIKSVGKSAMAGIAGMAMSATLALGSISDAMHPDYTMATVPLVEMYKTMGMGFLSDGRMVLVTTEFIGGGEAPPPSVNHKLLIITNPGAATAGDVKVKEVANMWIQPSGLTIVDNKIFVSDKDGFYQILDYETATPDLANNRKKIATWPDENKWNAGKYWHQWVFTPVYKNGFFYAPYSGSIRPGGPSDAQATSAYSGAFLKWDMNGTLTKFAGGLRSPNGANIGPNGDMFVADNQGSWVPSSTFMHMKQDKFYGHKQSPKRDSLGNVITAYAPNWAEGMTYERPTAWLDHGNVRASPSQPIYVDKGRYAGDWLLGDVNNPGLVRISLDDVQGTYNGAVFWFSKGMAQSAINRLAWGNDGSLYVGTAQRIAGNWPGGDKSPIYKVTPKATATAFDMKAVRHLADGVEILFTEAVDANAIAAANFSVVQWHYDRKEEYGKGKTANEARVVSGTELSLDGKRVHLKIAGLKDDYVAYIKLTNVKSATGAAIWNNESWFTINKLSTRAWDGTVSIADKVQPAGRLESLVRQRLTRNGLEVIVDGAGAHTATLRSITGAHVASVSGTGSASMVLPTQGLAKGLYLLEVRQGAEKVSRAVSLSF
jgi:hypothetical protein